MSTVLAVNGDEAEGRNTSNDCVLNQSQKQHLPCFTALFYLNRHLRYAELSNCPFVLLVNSTDPKGKFSFYAFIKNNIVILYLITSIILWSPSIILSICK